MNVLFPSREAYLLHRLQTVEERMAPLWPIRDVHFVVMWLLSIACIICSGAGWYGLILPIGALSVIAVCAFSRVAMKIHPLRNHRDWILNELSELDWEKYRHCARRMPPCGGLALRWQPIPSTQPMLEWKPIMHGGTGTRGLPMPPALFSPPPSTTSTGWRNHATTPCACIAPPWCSARTSAAFCKRQSGRSCFTGTTWRASWAENSRQRSNWKPSTTAPRRREGPMANVTPLTVEQIAEARKNATETEGHIVGKFIVFMCDSHEALRAALDAANRAVELRTNALRRLGQQVVALRHAPPTEQHRKWEALMDGTPGGTKPMTVYRLGSSVVVCGDPPDEEGTEESAHNCDAMGCTSCSHVLWRGFLADFYAMCAGRTEDAARAARAEADLAAARARVEELEREAVIDLHSTNAIRDDLAAANECIERQNANVRRLEADLAAMTAERDELRTARHNFCALSNFARRALIGRCDPKEVCEALIEYDAVEKGIREYPKCGIMCQPSVDLRTERDAALARCAELEAQRDEARRMYCSTERALRYEQGEKFSEHDIASEEWPSDADALCHPEKGGE
jgi:hypothetical protein